VSGGNYDDVWRATEAEQWYYTNSLSASWVYSPSWPPNVYGVGRAFFQVDLSGLSPSLHIAWAGLVCPNATAMNASYPKSYSVELVNGEGVECDNYNHALKGYGDLFDKTVSLGSLSVPVGGLPSGELTIPLNSAGIAYLEAYAGGIAPFGMRLSTDISGEVPGATGYEYLRFYGAATGGSEDSRAYFYIIYNCQGFIWVEGIYLAYKDATCQKRLTEGTDTGANGTAEYPWVDGIYQYYVDANGDVRRIEGSLTGLTGKLPSQISVNTKSPMLGTHFCYIDDTGAERCFEGTPA